MNTDHDVIARSLKEPAAFADLFDRHAATVYRYAASRSTRQVADDLLSETFLVAFEQRAKFNPERGEVKPWLLGIATTLLRKHRRVEARSYLALAAEHTRKVLSSDAFEDTDERLDAAAALRDVTTRLAKLPRGDRDVVILFAWEDLSYEQIAQALGIPVGTVRSRLNRARTKLGAALPNHTTNRKEAGHGFAGSAA